jgi:hypothetical protein
MAPGDPVGPGLLAARSFARVGGFFLRHPSIALSIGSVSHNSTNISTNATRFALNTNLPENAAMEGSHVNGYRHVLWQATISSKYGESIAKQVGNAHEDNPFASLKERSFESLSKADQTIDLLNNIIGRQIGKDNPDASMQELAIKTLDYYKESGVWTAKKQEDGSYNISPTRLTQEQYDNAYKAISTTNNNGYTPQQQTKRDAEIKQTQTQTWTPTP